MSLPNPNMDFTAFDNLPAALLDDLVENIEALADGSGLNTGDASNGVSNTNLKTGAGQPGGAWDSWTPTWTNLTVGNGTLVAKYKQTGKTVRAFIHLTFGNTTSISGTVSFTAPVSNANSTLKFLDCGRARFVDEGTDTFGGSCYFDTSATSIVIDVSTSNATYSDFNPISSTVPFTWTTTDALVVWFEYEAA